DDLDVIKEMCEWLAENGFKDSPLHFSRFHPQYQLTNLPATPVSTLEKARYVAIKAGINYIYIGNVPGSDAENTFCPNCNKIIIKRKGYRLLENNIENGKCKFCKTIINGIWD
ncbi:MAG: radical SAM protein, partial [Bacteroidetes bacterium]|nr:radical SAM protein [Bacteroidota bacterium]